MYLGVAQFGRALDLGSRGREFESLHSDHMTYSTGAMAIWVGSNITDLISTRLLIMRTMLSTHMLGIGVIGNTTDFDSVILGSSPGSPTILNKRNTHALKFNKRRGKQR